MTFSLRSNNNLFYNISDTSLGMQENAHTKFILCVMNYIDRYVLET